MNEIVKIIIGEKVYYRKKDILEEIKDGTGKEMSKKEIDNILKQYCTTISGFGRTLFILEEDVSNLTFPCEDGSFRLIKQTRHTDHNKIYTEKLDACKFALAMMIATMQNKMPEEQLLAYIEKKEKDMYKEAKEETEMTLKNFEKKNRKSKEEMYQEVIDKLNNSFKENNLAYKAFALEGYDKNVNDFFYMGAIVDKNGMIIDTMSECSDTEVIFDEERQVYALWDGLREILLSDRGEPKEIDEKYINELVGAINAGRYTIEDICQDDVSISVETKYGMIWCDGCFFGNTLGKVLV